MNAPASPAPQQLSSPTGKKQCGWLVLVDFFQYNTD
jgi:hypothetical protein